MNTADHTTEAATTAARPHHARRISASTPSSTSSSALHGRKLVHAAPTPFSEGIHGAKPIPAATTAAATAIPMPRLLRRRRAGGGVVIGGGGVGAMAGRVPAQGHRFGGHHAGTREVVVGLPDRSTRTVSR